MAGETIQRAKTPTDVEDAAKKHPTRRTATPEQKQAKMAQLDESVFPAKAKADKTAAKEASRAAKGEAKADKQTEKLAKNMRSSN